MSGSIGLTLVVLRVFNVRHSIAVGGHPGIQVFGAILIANRDGTAVLVLSDHITFDRRPCDALPEGFCGDDACIPEECFLFSFADSYSMSLAETTHAGLGAF